MEVVLVIPILLLITGIVVIVAPETAQSETLNYWNTSGTWILSILLTWITGTIYGKTDDKNGCLFSAINSLFSPLMFFVPFVGSIAFGLFMNRVGVHWVFSAVAFLVFFLLMFFFGATTADGDLGEYIKLIRRKK